MTQKQPPKPAFEEVGRRRHIAEAFSYRIFSTLIGFFVVYFITDGDFKASSAFSMAELIYKPMQYYIHRRIWFRWVTYGINRKKVEKSGENHTFE